MVGATGPVADFEASPTEEPRIEGPRARPEQRERSGERGEKNVGACVSRVGPRVHGRSDRSDGAHDWRPQPYNQEHAHCRTDYVQTD